MRRLLLALALPLLAAPRTPAVAMPAPVKPVTIKLATLFPEGSVWDQATRRMIAEIKEETEGRVAIRVYAGGVAGDESDLVRKMRIGQLHAASVTTSGLSELDESFRVLEIPGYFETDDELIHVLGELTPLFRERLDEKGWIFLNWGHTGWVRFFSKEPVRSIADLRSMKLFVWQNSGELEAWWKKNGFKPVPLAMTDAMTALQTGMIEVMPSTALAALSLQWFRRAPHMLDERVLGMVGATVVSKRTWKKISSTDQRAILAAAKRMEEHLFEVVPQQEVEAVEEMKKRGLSVHTLERDEDRRTWESLAGAFYEEMLASGEIVDVAERVRAERAAYRERR